MYLKAINTNTSHTCLSRLQKTAHTVNTESYISRIQWRELVHTAVGKTFFFLTSWMWGQTWATSVSGNEQNRNGSGLNFTSLSNLMHKRDQRHQLPRSHKSRQKTVSRSWQPGITVLLKNVYLMKSMLGVYLRKQCQCVRKMEPLSKWDFICILLYTVEVAARSSWSAI